MKRKILSHPDIAGLCQGLALQLHAGIRLGDGLFLLAQEETGPARALLDEMGRQLDEGGSLSAAVEKSEAFPAYVADMVRVGERTGRLEEALEALSAYYRERERMERQVRNALTYPSIILLLMLVVVGMLLVKVLPVFDAVYASIGGHLTGAAGGLLYLGQILSGMMPALWVLLAVAACGTLLLSCKRDLREKVLDIWRKHWGDKGIAARFNNARFARALAMGLSSGLALEEAVELASRLLENIPGAAARCHQCARLLEEGSGLGEALGSTGLLPLVSCRMLTLGFRSGSGDRVMEEIAQSLMDEANEALEDRVAKVEPAMVLTASLLVGVILLSVMLPLMNIMSSIG